MKLLDKVFAIVKRDALTSLRYRSAFVMQAAGLFAELAGLYFLARAVGAGFRPEGVAYFPFLFIGGGLYTFVIAGINGFITSIHEAQMTGTMEVLMSTSTPAMTVVGLTALSNLGLRFLWLATYLAVGFALFPVGAVQPNFTGAAVVFFLTMAVAVAVGIIAAAIQVATQKGGVVVWLMATFGWFLTGSMFPVASLPDPIRRLSYAIPFTYSLSASRQALLQGATFSQLFPSIVILLIFGLVTLPFSLLIFSSAMRRARLRGSLSFY